MAEKNAATNGNVRPPEGFRRAGSVADAPWVWLEVGNTIHGKVLNIFTRPDSRVKNKDGSPGTSKFFQIEALSEMKCRAGTGETAKAVQGTVVNLNYGPKTSELENYIPDVKRGAEVHVWAPVLGKMKVGPGKTNSMWIIDLHVRIVTPASGSSEPDFGGDSAGAGA